MLKKGKEKRRGRSEGSKEITKGKTREEEKFCKQDGGRGETDPGSKRRGGT